jgi:hypothetical protein
MAFKQTLSFDCEVFLKSSFGNIQNGTQQFTAPFYINIECVVGDKESIKAIVKFSCDSNVFHKQYQIPVSVGSESKNFIAQAYEHLKTLPEFADAIDC